MPLKCDHVDDRRVCRKACARCGHICPVHRGGPDGRGSDGAGCWECGGACRAWLEPTGVALLDQEVTLAVEDRHVAERRLHATIRVRGKVAGRLVLAPGRRDDEVMVARVRLIPAVRGRGVAAEVYAELGRQLVARELVLTSGTARSRDADRVWEGQRARGHARLTAAGYYRLEAPPPRPPTWTNTRSA